MTRFEYLVAFVENDRVLKTNGHWQGEIAEGEEGAHASCPDKFTWLAGAGAQGWDLVAVDPEETGNAVLYFKRAHTSPS